MQEARPEVSWLMINTGQCWPTGQAADVDAVSIFSGFSSGCPVERIAQLLNWQ